MHITLLGTARVRTNGALSHSVRHAHKRAAHHSSFFLIMVLMEMTMPATIHTKAMQQAAMAMLSGMSIYRWPIKSDDVMSNPIVLSSNALFIRFILCLFGAKI